MRFKCGRKGNDFDLPDSAVWQSCVKRRIE